MISSFLFVIPTTPVSIKFVEQQMVKISETFYVNKFETTNAEYRKFLSWAENDNQQEIIKTSSVRSQGWESLDLSEKNTEYYSSHQAFDNYPVVNITYDGAINFCQWLTDQYNTSKKRKFNKVKFRLPTSEEWMDIAKGGRERDIIYPWGGPYTKNSKGKYVANFRAIVQSEVKMDINKPNSSFIELQKLDQSKKGRKLTQAVNSHLHGPLGLYNLSGNAAEMLAERGSTKGGSFGSSGYYIRIDAEDEFKGFDYSPYVGFRYVMEVLEK